MWLRWLWYNRDSSNHPWKGSCIPCSNVDHGVFAACSWIEIGDGATSFWFDHWLFGVAPNNLAPDVFPLARRTPFSVKEELSGHKWMHGLSRINSATQVSQFVQLWLKSQHAHLHDHQNSVSWKLLTDNL